METPNLDVLRETAKKIDEEYDLKTQIRRYKTMFSELVENASTLGLTGEDDAARALFVADFIVVSSEVPLSPTDEERRISVIRIPIPVLLIEKISQER